MLDQMVNWLRDEFEANPNPATLEQTKAQWLMLRFLPRRQYEPNDPIAPGSLVLLETEGKQSLCLVVPAHGGLVTRWQDYALQMVTPESPLGAALLGKKAGDQVQVQLGQVVRQYQIKQCC